TTCLWVNGNQKPHCHPNRTSACGKYPLNGHPGAVGSSRNQTTITGITCNSRNKVSKAMMDQQNFEAARPVSADPLPVVTPKHPASIETLAKEAGLKLGDQNELTIRRVKRGKSYSFVRANGTAIRHSGTIRRLHSMAVPPAYAEVRYSPDPNSH